MTCPPSSEEFVHLTVSIRRTDLATILGIAPPSASEVFVTGGDAPRLPDGYTRRTLDDACRRGELRGTPVPRSGWRITAEDLATWAAARTRRRQRRVAPKPIDNVVDEQALADRLLLTQAGGAARRAG